MTDIWIYNFETQKKEKWSIEQLLEFCNNEMQNIVFSLDEELISEQKLLNKKCPDCGSSLFIDGDIAKCENQRSCGFVINEKTGEKI